MTHLVREQTTDAALGALHRWFAVYGMPDRFALDGVREFYNSAVRAEIKQIDVMWLSPGHPQGPGVVARLNGTLGDHLHIFQLEKALPSEVAIGQAILAYKHLVHSVAGSTLMEVFGLRPRPDLSSLDGNTYQQTQTGSIWRTVKDNTSREKSRWFARENAGDLA